MKRRIILSTINIDYTEFSLSVEFLAAKILSDTDLSRQISLIKKVYRPKTPPKKISQQIIAHAPNLVGFSCYVWNMNEIMEIAGSIKTILPKTLIVLGGPEVAGLGREIMEKHPYIDGVVMGEGEEVFAQMLTGWLQSDKLESLPGTLVRQEDHLLIPPPPCTPLKDLDKNPSPYDNVKLSSVKPSCEIWFQTLRGCNRGCFYCYCNRNASSVRFYSFNRINEDLEKIKRIGVKRINIFNSNFFCYYNHAAKVIQILKEKGLRFQVEINAEDLDERSIDLLASSTCDQVNFGLQSSNPKALKLCGRSYNMALLKSNIRQLAKKAPTIALRLDLIFGLPGDTFKDFLNSIDFAVSLPIETINISHLHVLPETPFYKQPQMWGIEFDLNPPHLVYKTDDFSIEGIKQARMIQSAVLDFYSSCTIRPVMQFIYKNIPQTRSRFLNRLVLWDEKRKKRFLKHYPGKSINLSDLSYLLSGVRYIYPDIFSTQEFEYIQEWYRFRRYLHRLEKITFHHEANVEPSGNKNTLWKRSDNIIMGRSRIKPRLNLNALAPEPLEKKERRLVLQKSSRKAIHIYEISEEMEKLLRFFRKPKALNSYLSVADTGSETVVDCHIRIQYAREKGFIQPLSV